ncbi:MAG: Heimdall-CTERM domain-containing surface protein [Candidatus Hodarchaeales archaeon]
MPGFTTYSVLLALTVLPMIWISRRKNNNPPKEKPKG